jgi:diadenylate cyclase
MERLKQFRDVISEIGFAGVADMAVVALVVYAFLVALKRTRRSGLILAGIVILAGLYLIALKLNLLLTVTLLQGFFAVILVALVVIFQEDLRYFFERVGLWWVERRLPRYKRHAGRMARREVEILTRTLGDLAREKIGALIVLRGGDVINRHLEGGEVVDGRLSEPVLKSIFDPHSIGHDGAVTIERERIAKLGCHLPLSKNLDKLPRSGTRHAAALGLSERSDALCLVVSEERGTISAARRGDIRVVPGTAELASLLEEFYDEVSPESRAQPWEDFIRKNSREKLIALVLSVALWVVVVHRAQETRQTFSVKVQYGLLGPDLSVTRRQPDTVHVTFLARRQEFTFFRPQDIKLFLNLADARPGRLTVPITSSELSYPNKFYLDDIEPRQVVLQIEKRPPETDKSSPTTNTTTK